MQRQTEISFQNILDPNDLSTQFHAYRAMETVPDQGRNTISPIHVCNNAVFNTLHKISHPASALHVFGVC